MFRVGILTVSDKGHAGERVLNQLAPGGFHHVQQSVRVVEVLEKDGEGLNLIVEVRDDVPEPVVAPDDLLVRVQVTTVNRTDCGFRQPEPFFVRLFKGTNRADSRVVDQTIESSKLFATEIHSGFPQAWISDVAGKDANGMTE